MNKISVSTKTTRRDVSLKLTKRLIALRKDWDIQAALSFRDFLAAYPERDFLFLAGRYEVSLVLDPWTHEFGGFILPPSSCSTVSFTIPIVSGWTDVVVGFTGHHVVFRVFQLPIDQQNQLKECLV